MNYWEWDSSLSIGIDVIDNQHRRMVDYLNELDVALIELDRDKVGQVLMGLTDYTISHFAFEESLMEQAGYPLADPHKRVHEAFSAHIAQYKERHEQGEEITRQLITDLRIWLTNHIKNDDADFAPYAKKITHKSWLRGLLERFFG